jgi:predicted MFS family arabinose efflux permease
MAIRFVPNTPPVGGQRFDYLGAGLLSGALLSIALAVTSGQELGYRSAAILGLFAAAAVLAGAFVVVELRNESPMLDLRLFRDPLLSVSVVTGYLTFVCLSATFFLLPFYLEGVLGFDTRTVGLALGIGPLIIGVISPMAGTWSDRIGIRRLTLAGLLILAVTFTAFRTLSTDTTFLSYAFLAVPVGVGIGMFQSPNNSAIMGSMPRRYAGVGGGILTLTRLLGQISGVAVLGSVWAVRVAARSEVPLAGDAASASPAAQVWGLHDTALVMAALMAAAVVIGWWGMRKEQANRSGG